VQGHFGESLILSWELRDRRGVAESLAGLAQVRLKTGFAQKAVCLWTKVYSMRESIHAPLSVREQRMYVDHLARARVALDEAAFVRAGGLGCAMTIEQTVEFALNRNEAEAHR
jgi:hypothetical protein